MNWRNVLVFTVISLVLIFTIIMQVTIDLSQATKLELNLLSLMQFLSSIFITFLVSREVLKKEFETSQKSFGYSSYRRIIEIEKSVKLINNDLEKKSKDNEVIKSILLNFKQLLITIESSELDWVEIIGDDLAVLREYVETESNLSSQKSSGEENEKNEKVSKLKERFEDLPNELRMATKSDFEDDSSKYLQLKDFLVSEMRKSGELRLTVFTSDKYSNLMRQCNKNDELFLSLEILSPNVKTVLIQNEGQAIIGGLSNRTGFPYEIFRKVILELYTKHDMRIYFLDKHPNSGLFNSQNFSEEDNEYYKVIAYPKPDTLE